MNLYFDTSTYIPTDDKYMALPVGSYIAMITKVEEKEGKTSGIPYLSLTIQIIEGDFSKRIIWDMLSINSPNEVAKNIANKKLNEIAKAIGILVIESADSFLYKELGVEVVLDKNDKDKNQIKKYISARDVGVSPAIIAASKNTYTATSLEDEVPF